MLSFRSYTAMVNPEDSPPHTRETSFLHQASCFWLNPEERAYHSSHARTTMPIFGLTILAADTLFNFSANSHDASWSSSRHSTVKGFGLALLTLSDIGQGGQHYTKMFLTDRVNPTSTLQETGP